MTKYVCSLCGYEYDRYESHSESQELLIVK